MNLKPSHVVVNNLEVDHLNFYDGLSDIVMAEFIEGNDALKTLALNWDDSVFERSLSNYRTLRSIRNRRWAARLRSA